MKKWILIFFLLISLQGFSQEKIEITASDYQNTRVEMADVMRSEGKIYVLVGIIAIIFTGIVVYLVNTEKKVNKLEKLVQE